MTAAASMPPPPVKTPWASATASPLAVLFAILSSRLGGDAEPLAEDAIARLVEQARAGDTGARRTLYIQHVDRVFRTVRGMLRSDADAEDVTQDALLTVLTSLHKYTPRVGRAFRGLGHDNRRQHGAPAVSPPPSRAHGHG